ncbi:hypothetical protein PR048_015839 [Dryococelus australis]|uniref:Integrase catalytic domain-containing protein n=1 Tax=Dryococelus australis TaxID=614101 RepID=A0ABQ9HI38_9NEOP|nr:hypothetical protein PR048_015839 [Dryococelus australis]
MNINLIFFQKDFFVADIVAKGNAIRQHFIYKGMDANISERVKCCKNCALRKPAQNTQLGFLSSDVAEKPMEKMFIDFVGPFPRSKLGNNILLVCVDAFTKFVWLIPLRKADAMTTIRGLQTHIFHNFGTPSIVCTKTEYDGCYIPSSHFTSIIVLLFELCEPFMPKPIPTKPTAQQDRLGIRTDISYTNGKGREVVLVMDVRRVEGEGFEVFGQDAIKMFQISSIWYHEESSQLLPANMVQAAKEASPLSTPLFLLPAICRGDTCVISTVEGALGLPEKRGRSCNLGRCAASRQFNFVAMVGWKATRNVIEDLGPDSGIKDSGVDAKRLLLKRSIGRIWGVNCLPVALTFDLDPYTAPSGTSFVWLLSVLESQLSARASPALPLVVAAARSGKSLVTTADKLGCKTLPNFCGVLFFLLWIIATKFAWELPARSAFAFPGRRFAVRKFPRAADACVEARYVCKILGVLKFAEMSKQISNSARGSEIENSLTVALQTQVRYTCSKASLGKYHRQSAARSTAAKTQSTAVSVQSNADVSPRVQSTFLSRRGIPRATHRVAILHSRYAMRFALSSPSVTAAMQPSFGYLRFSSAKKALSSWLVDAAITPRLSPGGLPTLPTLRRLGNHCDRLPAESITYSASKHLGFASQRTSGFLIMLDLVLFLETRSMDKISYKFVKLGTTGVHQQKPPSDNNESDNDDVSDNDGEDNISEDMSEDEAIPTDKQSYAFHGWWGREATRLPSLRLRNGFASSSPASSSSEVLSLPFPDHEGEVPEKSITRPYA